MGFHPSNFLPLPEISSCNGKIATTNSSSSEIFNALLAGRFIFLVTPSVVVTHPIGILCTLIFFLSTGTNRGGEITISQTFCALPKTQTTDDNGACGHRAPSIRFAESRALNNVPGVGPNSKRGNLAGYWNPVLVQPV